MTTAAELEKTVELLSGPLLPLSPPRPLSRPLPPLPTRPHPSPHDALAPGWTRETLVLPAAFPRSFPRSTKKPHEPARDPTVAAAAGPGGQRADPQRALEQVVQSQIDSFAHPIGVGNAAAEAEGQEQLVVVGNRYRPARTASNAAGPGLTLVLSHANGFYKGEPPQLHSPRASWLIAAVPLRFLRGVGAGPCLRPGRDRAARLESPRGGDLGPRLRHSG